MLTEKSQTTDVASANLIAGGGSADQVKAGGVFKVVCHDKDGNLKWETESHNLVVNVGLVTLLLGIWGCMVRHRATTRPQATPCLLTLVGLK
jgi:hypothetical protein